MRRLCGEWGGVVGELRNKTKLQPSSVEVALWLSLAKVYFWDPKENFLYSIVGIIGRLNAKNQGVLNF